MLSPTEFLSVLDSVWRENVEKHEGLKLWRTFYEKENYAQSDLVDNMLFGCHLEMKASERAGDSARRFHDHDIRVLHERHYNEEIKHFKLVKHRLAEIDVDYSRYVPDVVASQMVELYKQYETPVERIAFFNMGSERTAVASLIAEAKRAVQLGDFETAKMYYAFLLPDEAFHTDYGPSYMMMKYANTDELQSRAIAALKAGLEIKSKLMKNLVRSWTTESSF